MVDVYCKVESAEAFTDGPLTARLEITNILKINDNKLRCYRMEYLQLVGFFRGLEL